MGTFTDSLVSEMAQNFNEALDGVDPIDLSDDKTLKWRGLLNNKYASAAGRRGVVNKKVAYDMQEPNSSPQSKQSSHNFDHNDEPSMLGNREKDTEHNEVPYVNDVGDIDKSISKKIDVANSPKRLLRRKANTSNLIEKINVIKKNKKERTDETAIDGEGRYANLMRVRKGRVKRHSTELFEPKALRPRRSDRQLQQSVANECDEDEADEPSVNVPNRENATTISGSLKETCIKDIQTSSEDLQLTEDSYKICKLKKDESLSVTIANKPQSSDYEKMKYVSTFVKTVLGGTESHCKTEEIGEDIKDDQTDKTILLHIGSTEAPIRNTDISQDLLFPSASSINMLVPKKRGRKPGFKKLLHPVTTAIKKSTRISRDNDPDPAFDPTKKHASTSVDPNNSPSQRLSRRIKPTAKILANDELRYGFELQNNARLSLSSENLNAEKSPHKEDKPLQLHPSGGLSNILSIESIDQDDDQIKNRTIKASEVSPRRRAPCPDPVEFINSIKMEKINLHRSPEGNKKMSIKQRKRLLKLKEKHFYKLGLQRSRISFPDSSHDSTEAEEIEDEFVPNNKVSVGRPNVTLRLRANTSSLDKPCSLNLDINSRKLKYQKAQINATKRVYTVIPSANHKTSLILSTKKNSVNPLPTQLHYSTHEVVPNSTDTTICLCSKPSNYFIYRTPDSGLCRANDEIEGHKIGCCNEITGSELLQLRRPSVRVKYSLLCSSHVQRLINHQSCAGCGIFCTQGNFIVCPRSHFFHKNCATKFILNAPYNLNVTDFVCPSLVLRCPHCGVDAPDKEIRVSMQCRTIPVFLPYQRVPKNLSRMCIGPHTHASGALALQKNGIGKKQFLWELEKLIPSGVIDVLLRAKNLVDGNPSDRSSAKYGSKDVFEAITTDNVNRMAEIIASGFDISAKLTEFRSGTCLHLVSNFGSLSMSYLILSRSPSVDFLNNRDRELRSALMCAVLGAKNDIIRMLVQCGADVTLRGPGGMTALHLAAKTGNFTAAQIILDSYRRATSVTSFGMFVNAVDDGGWTTIVWAAEIGHSNMVEYLVQCGADLSICDAERNTVLHWAALSDDVATVRPLLLTADLNVQNVNGDTPIHIACRNSNIRMCLMFLAHGASLELLNDLGETAFDGISDEDGACAKAVRFNMKLRALARFGEQTIACQDISKGRESYPIKVIKNRRRTTNSVEQDIIDDNELPHFIYITKSIILQNSIQIDRRISQMRVCSCIDNCTSSGCQCSEISVQNWYNAEGRLHGTFNFSDPAMIFECNDVCGCNKLHCKNRVVQNGQKVALQVIECGGAKGYGVSAVGDIVRGTFVAEYTGEILTDAEADRRVDGSYFFDLDASEHCIDAHYYGNVSRFFNHSCAPNLVPIRVFYDHQDLRFPKIALFTIRDICPDEELTFDYGDKFWQNKTMFCECGSDVCRFPVPFTECL